MASRLLKFDSDILHSCQCYKLLYCSGVFFRCYFLTISSTENVLVNDTTCFWVNDRFNESLNASKCSKCSVHGFTHYTQVARPYAVVAQFTPLYALDSRECITTKERKENVWKSRAHLTPPDGPLVVFSRFYSPDYIICMCLICISLCTLSFSERFTLLNVNSLAVDVNSDSLTVCCTHIIWTPSIYDYLIFHYQHKTLKYHNTEKSQNQNCSDY